MEYALDVEIIEVIAILNKLVILPTGYRLNSDNNCLICPENCNSCRKDSNGEMYCTSCFYGYGLTPQRRCNKCPEHCTSCFWKTSTNSFGCYSCEQPSYYSFQQN